MSKNLFQKQIFPASSTAAGDELSNTGSSKYKTPSIHHPIYTTTTTATSSVQNMKNNYGSVPSNAHQVKQQQSVNHTQKLSTDQSIFLKRQMSINPNGLINNNANNSRNVIGKKQSSGLNSSGNGTQRQSVMPKPHFEMANIGFRKASMQNYQPNGFSQASHAQQTNTLQQLIKTQSQNRMTPIQKMITTSSNINMILQSIDQFSAKSKNSSRNINIPKSSSQQNPQYFSNDNTQNHASQSASYQKPSAPGKSQGNHHLHQQLSCFSQQGIHPPQQLLQCSPGITMNQKRASHQVAFGSQDFQNTSTSTYAAPRINHNINQQSSQKHQSKMHFIINQHHQHQQCETGASIDHSTLSLNSRLHHQSQRSQSNFAFAPNRIIENENSLKSSLASSEGNIGTMAAASLLEGNIAIHIPKSKINTAAHRHALIKNQSKVIGDDDGENITISDDDICANNNQQKQQPNIHNAHEYMKSTVLLSEQHTAQDHIKEEVSQDEASISSQSSSCVERSRGFNQPSNHGSDNSEDDGILPLLEGFCKKGDLKSLQQFQCLIKGDVQRVLLYRSIEFKQVSVLKFLLTETQKITQNFNLLHIASRSKSIENDLEIVKAILKYDPFANLNSQDTYGNTPVHLAAQNGKAEVLQYFLNRYNPQIYLKNSEGQSALHASSTQEIFKIFVNYIQKLKDAINKEDGQSNSSPSSQNPKEKCNQQDGVTSSARSHKQSKKVMNRNKSEHQFTHIQQTVNQPQIQGRPSLRAPLKDITNNGQQQIFNDKNYASNKAESRKHQQIYQNYYCETEPTAYSSAKHKKPSKLGLDHQISSFQPVQTLPQMQQPTTAFKEEDFEKVVDYSESSSSSEDENQESQTLQFCEQIEEVSEESLQNSIILLQQQNVKIGPQSFDPVGLLGQGSFGEVYLVRKKDNKQLFAMKVLQKQRILGQNLVKYAVTERNVLSYTRHPFIVGLNYAFQTRDKLILILDYCPGGDLGKVISREKRLSEDRARIYLAEILLALEDLHKRDIIFRDLKPDNVVLDENGHALLTDFGLSKEGVLDNQGARSFCGSVAYLAPEMLKRTGHGKSVDWYLLGVLLYEMLVGIPPYFTNNREKLFQNIQRGPLLIPSQLSQEAKTLLIGLLSKNPLKRLGAGARDAEEVKEHPFFRDVDWSAVYNRRMAPPKPEIREVKPIDLHINQIFNELKQGDSPNGISNNMNGHNDDENKLPGWSFVTPDSHHIHSNIQPKVQQNASGDKNNKQK